MTSLPVWYLRLTFFNLRRVDMNKSLIIKIIVLCLVSITASAQDKVVLVGDSLMAGYGLPKEQQLSTVLESNLQKKGYNIKIINGGKTRAQSAEIA